MWSRIQRSLTPPTVTGALDTRSDLRAATGVVTFGAFELIQTVKRLPESPGRNRGFDTALLKESGREPTDVKYYPPGFQTRRRSCRCGCTCCRLPPRKTNTVTFQELWNRLGSEVSDLVTALAQMMQSFMLIWRRFNVPASRLNKRPVDEIFLYWSSVGEIQNGTAAQ